MTRFVYIADTHLGASPMGYQQQKGYPEKLAHLVSLLDTWIQEEGNITFVLHGGDMIDQTTMHNIREARDVFRLSVPVYLCLGNHDLTEPDAVGMWLSEASGFFLNDAPNYSIQNEDCFVHVIPNQWGQLPYCWQNEQNPHFLTDQLGFLEKALTKHTEGLHILSTHSPILGVPSEQTGLDGPYHRPPESFSEILMEVVEQHPQIRCVLSGHNHINTHSERDGVHFVTATGFVEVPFEFKLVEVDSDGFRMSTVGLGSEADFRTEYNYDKTYVQGRKTDRSFEE